MKIFYLEVASLYHGKPFSKPYLGGGGRDVRSTPEAPRKFFSMVGDLTPLVSGGEHLERRCIGHKHAPGTGQSMAAFWGGVW